MAHFWDGQGEHGRASGKRKGSRRRGGETLRCTNPCQEGKSHQHQRDVSVPTDEATNFVMVQPQVFGVFKILGLDHYEVRDRKSTRLNSSHQIISYAVFCLKKKNIHHII